MVTPWNLITAFFNIRGSVACLATEALKHPMLQAVEDIEEKVGNKCPVARLD